MVLGVVTPIGDQGGDIAKTAALAAGYPETVAGVQLNRFCASGLEAVNQAATRVRSGFEDLILAGGVESMSRVPMGSDGGAWAMDPRTALDTSFVPQGIGADLIATLEGWTRAGRRRASPPSRRRAPPRRRPTATSTARSSRSRTSTASPCWSSDEFIRPGTTVESLAGLKPSFAAIGDQGGFDSVALEKYHWVEEIDHVHHAGNSSGIVDGAALVAVGTEQVGTDLGLTPRARILAAAVSGADPTIMLTGPAPASRKALAKAGLSVEDIDLFEINEAFAAVAMRFMRDLDLPAREGQRQRRRHRDGPPARRDRRDDPRHPDRRARAPRPALRPGHALRRRRHGHRHRRRARLTCDPRDRHPQPPSETA